MSLDNRLARFAEEGNTKLVLDYINDTIKIIENDPNKDTFIQENYNIALIWASSNNRLETIQALIHHGADINIYGSRKHLPLCEAVRSGKIDTVKLLLNNGADPNLKDCRNKNAFEHAKHKKYKKIELLITESIQKMK